MMRRVVRQLMQRRFLTRRPQPSASSASFTSTRGTRSSSVSPTRSRSVSYSSTRGTFSRRSSIVSTTSNTSRSDSSYLLSNESGYDPDTDSTHSTTYSPRRSRSTRPSHSRRRDESASPQRRHGRLYFPAPKLDQIETTDVVITETPNLQEYGRQLMVLKLQTGEDGMEWNQKHPENCIVTYTDGSCFNNEMSGFGIYHGLQHELNRSVRIDGPLHNSGLAEILAANRALNDILAWQQYNGERIIVRTDFLPLINRMSKGLTDHKNNRRFAEHYDQLAEMADRFPQGVSFEHVYGHDGNPGNEAADELARQAALSTASKSRRARSMSRERNTNRRMGRGRSASRNNDHHHIRSHSAHIGARRPMQTP